MTQPTIGHIVHYVLSQADVTTIDRDRTHRHANDRGNQATEGQVCPAIIVRTFGGPAANLQVLLDGADSYWATSRVEGNAPGQWSWPPRA